MILRLAIAAAILLFGTGAVILLKAHRLHGAERAITSSDPLLVDSPRGVATILYFTAPNCAACTYAQEPALEQLRSEFGEKLRIITVDTSEDQQAAQRWHVATVPTTYVIAPDGTPLHINTGATDARALRRQIGAKLSA